MSRLTPLFFLVIVGCSSSPQEKAVSFVERKGGTVEYDKRTPPSVWHVHLRDCKITDADLKELTALTELTSLNLAGNPITDEGVKDLAPFTKLADLWLRQTEASDASIPQIIQFKHLTALYLGGSKVSLAGRKEIINALPNCEISE